MTDAIAKLLADHSAELLGQNVSGISEELRTNPEGKLSVSVGFKLQLVGTRLFASSAMAYSRKFQDSVEGVVQLPDPNQPGLPLDSDRTVTILDSDGDAMKVPKSVAKALKGRKA